METIIDQITSNKILIIILILIISAIIYYMLKGVLKVIIIVAIALILYYLYMNFNEKKNFDPLLQHLDKAVKGLNEKKEKTNKIIDLIDKVNIKD